MTPSCINPDCCHASWLHDEPINSVISFYSCPCPCERAIECEGLPKHTHWAGKHPVSLLHLTLPFKGSRGATVPGAWTQHLTSVYCQPLDVIGSALTSGRLHGANSSAVCQDVSLWEKKPDWFSLSGALFVPVFFLQFPADSSDCARFVLFNLHWKVLFKRENCLWCVTGCDWGHSRERLQDLTVPCRPLLREPRRLVRAFPWTPAM